MIDAALKPFGLTPVWAARFEMITADGVPARVVRQDRGAVIAVTGTEQVMAFLKGDYPVTPLVGDWITVIEGDVVGAILERDSLLVRQTAHSEQEQGVAANVDNVFIVCALDRPVNLRRIERAVTQTWQSGATPIVILSKADVAEDVEAVRAELIAKTDVDVLSVSSKVGDGLEAMWQRMANKTSVLVGESGAGKSTLLNALMGEVVMKTGEVRGSDAKGRHTTTRRELHVTPHGVVIDTPGVRALGLWAETEAVDQTFPEIAELAENCRFSDCAHKSEPGCAVNDALKAGEVTAERVGAWKAQLGEIEANELRALANSRRPKGR